MIFDRRIPTGTAVRWHYHARLIHAIMETREKLVEVFEYILEHDEEFEGSVLNEARGYRNILTDFQFVFCLNIFSAVFGLTTVLYDIVQSKQFDIACCVTKVQETKAGIQELRNSFESSWNSTLEVADIPMRRGQTEQEVKASFRQIFFSVVDTTVVQIDIRFESFNSRKFVSLLDILNTSYTAEISLKKN